MKGNNISIRTFAIGLVASSVSATLYAEEHNPAAEKQKLEVISVTAQKRVENIQDVPLAISVINNDKLNTYTASGDDIRFLNARVPSVVAESSLGRTYPRFFIRGFGNTDFRANASQPVELVIDEVIQSNPNLKAFPAFDLERIEVLKGPQGTLFGRNTPAGIIKLDTKKPTEDFDAYFKLAVGSFNQLNSEGALGGQLIENTLSGRVSVLKQTRDDYVDNHFTNQKDALGGYDDEVIRTQLLWTPDDDLSVLFNYHRRELDGTAAIFYANAINQGQTGVSNEFDRESVAQDGQNQQILTQNGGSIRLDYSFSALTLTSISAIENVQMFSRGDVDGGYGCGFCDTENGPGFIPFSVETSGDNDVEQISQELRLASDTASEFSFQTGIFYFHENLKSDELAYDSVFSPGSVTEIIKINQKNTTWGVFGSASYDVNEKLSLSAGLRYSKDKKDFSAIGILPEAQGNKDSTNRGNISWDMSTKYTLNNDTMLFARLAKGFRAPTIQGSTNFITTVDEEQLISVEAGIKTSLLDDIARLNATLYHFEVDGQQLTAVGGEDNQTRLLNANKTLGQGAELELELLATDNLMLSLGVSYNDTEIDDPNLGVPFCGIPNCTVLDPILREGIAAIDGNRLPQAPKWIASFNAQYLIPIETGEFYIATDWSYKSETNLFLYESTEFTAEQALLGGLRVGYKSNSDYEIAIFGRNITDEQVVTGALDFNNFAAIVNEPRTFGIEYKMMFY